MRSWKEKCLGKWCSNKIEIYRTNLIVCDPCSNLISMRTIITSFSRSKSENTCRNWIHIPRILPNNYVFTLKPLAGKQILSPKSLLAGSMFLSCLGRKYSITSKKSKGNYIKSRLTLDKQKYDRRRTSLNLLEEKSLS